MIYTTIILIIFVLILFLFICMFHKAYKILTRLMFPNGTKQSIITDSEFNRIYFNIKTCNSLKLVGYIAEPSSSPKGIIVVCHNLGGSKEGVWKYAEFLCKVGYMVVAFDFINHGESGRHRKLKFNHKDELTSVMSYINEINHKNLPVGILGLSMGSLASLLYTADSTVIKALIIDGGPLLYMYDYPEYVAKIYGIKSSLMRKYFLYFCMYFTDLKQIGSQTRNALMMLEGRPILLIQGEKDFMCPQRNTDEALAILKSDMAERWVVRDANHLMGFYMANEEYKARVVKFFDRYIGGETTNENTSV